MGGAERVQNLLTLTLERPSGNPAGHSFDARSLTRLFGAVATGMSVYELEPGNASWPYHFEVTEEEWLIVLVGRPTLRTPDGERELGPWDCAFFPTGEAGAHKVTNRTDETVRVCIWSNRFAVATTVYPDSEKVGAWPPGKLFRLADAVDYFTGEV